MDDLFFEGDSGDYELLIEAAAIVRGVPGLSCELGLREGAGTATLIRAFGAAGESRVHVGIDPYGAIPYELAPGHVYEGLYPYQMKRRFLSKVYPLCDTFNGIDFHFFCMEDTEFFKRFSDGIPIYARRGQLVNHYALVHLDGPHGIEPLAREIDFFAPSMSDGGVIIIDDVDYFGESFPEIERGMLQRGFTTRFQQTKKAVFQIT